MPSRRMNRDFGIWLGFFLQNGKLSVYDGDGNLGEIAMRTVSALDFAEVGRVVVSMAGFRLAQKYDRADGAQLHTDAQCAAIPCPHTSRIAIDSALFGKKVETPDGFVPFWCPGCGSLATHVLDDQLIWRCPAREFGKAGA